MQGVWIENSPDAPRAMRFKDRKGDKPIGKQHAQGVDASTPDAVRMPAPTRPMASGKHHGDRTRPVSRR